MSSKLCFHKNYCAKWEIAGFHIVLQGVRRGEDFWLWSANWRRRHVYLGFLWKVYDLHHGSEGCCKRLHNLENDDQRDLPGHGERAGSFLKKGDLIQGLFDVHPSFQNSTLESFVSHGSGAPGLDVVVDKYHDMVGIISLMVTHHKFHT